MSKIPNRKTKKLFYRRASWPAGKILVLETLLKNAHDAFATSAERTFAGLYGTEIQGARYKHDDQIGILLQIATSVPDQPTSAIAKPSNATSSDIEIVSAPTGCDFLDGDIFTLVKGNNVILCQSGVRENVALKYIIEMLQKHGHVKEAAELKLERIAKSDKIKMIKAEGVKSIELNASIYEASMRQSEVKDAKAVLKVTDLPGIVVNHLLKIFSNNQTMKEAIANENVNIKLSLSFDGKEAKRHTKDSTFGLVGKQRLEAVSEKILTEAKDEEEDGFTIVTGDGNRITHDEILVSANYRVDTFGKSLSVSNAWDQLVSYYQQLNHRGILDQ